MTQQNNKKLKTVIFGGSFDPVTKAHMGVIENLSVRFDRVIVLPAFISPFKKNADTIEGQDRLDLLENLCKDFTNVEVSSYELDGGGISYSYKSAEHFFVEDEQLFFAVGSDAIYDFDKWKRTDILKKLCTFYIIPRPFFPLLDDDIKRAEKFVSITFADFVGLEGSSALLKASVAFGRHHEIVPKSVAEYIDEKNLYKNYVYIYDAYKVFGLKQSRIDHTYGTVKSAVTLSKRYGADTDKAVRAAMLHDIGKYCDYKELQNQGYVFDEDLSLVPEACRHAVISKAIAEKYLGEKDADVLNAILLHTTGDVDMTLMTKIIFVADYIEEGRSFDALEKIRQKAYVDIDLAVSMIYDNTIEYLSKRGGEIHPKTFDAGSYYKVLCNNKRSDINDTN